MKKLALALSVISFMVLMVGCNRDAVVDKTKLLGADYRLFQETPAWDLAKAVEDGDVKTIRKEISKNKSLINFRDPIYGSPLLIFAVYHANYESVKTLLEEEADPNMQNFHYGDSGLSTAIGIGGFHDGSAPEFLKLLLKYGGNPNAEQMGSAKTRNTPLMIACRDGKLAYIKILVNAGAQVGFVNEHGDSALSWAAMEIGAVGDPDVITYLIQKGADFRGVLYKTIPENEPKYLTDAMRFWTFEIGSSEYKKKMQLVEFLKKNGMDYRKSPIPSWYLKDYSKDYLVKY